MSDQHQRLALKDLEIMRLREALENTVLSLKGYRMELSDNQPCDAEKATVLVLSTPPTYDDLMAWHNEQLGEKCALLTIREQLEPKIDILFSGINKLPVGIYNLIPIKKDK